MIKRVDFFVKGEPILLVLSRKANQEIMIGEHIVVNIVKVNNGKIKLGITAPENMPIVRTELKPEEQPGEKS